MSVSYDGLWIMLKSNMMKKKDLAKAAELSAYTMTKLNKNEYVSLEVLAKICKIFHCEIEDIVKLEEKQ